MTMQQYALDWKPQTLAVLSMYEGDSFLAAAFGLDLAFLTQYSQNADGIRSSFNFDHIQLHIPIYLSSIYPLFFSRTPCDANSRPFFFSLIISTLILSTLL